METLKKTILAGKLSPVYFFHGPESYLKEEFTAMIRSAAFPSEEEATCNTHVIYGPDITPGDLVAKASEYPMFSPKQLIIVRQFEKIKKPPSKELQKQHDEKLASYMKSPAEFTILVLDAEQLEKKGCRKKTIQHPQTIPPRLPAHQDPRPVRHRAGTRGWMGIRTRRPQGLYRLHTALIKGNMSGD